MCHEQKLSRRNPSGGPGFVKLARTPLPAGGCRQEFRFLELAPLRGFVYGEDAPDANIPHKHPNREPLFVVFTSAYSSGEARYLSWTVTVCCLMEVFVPKPPVQATASQRYR